MTEPITPTTPVAEAVETVTVDNRAAAVALLQAADIEETVVDTAEGEKPATSKTEAEKTPDIGKQQADQKLAGKLAQIVSRDKKLQAQKVALREPMQKVAAYEAALAKAKEDPLSFLEHVGLSYEDITERIINRGSPETALQDQVTNLTKRLSDREEVERQNEKAAIAAQQVAVVDGYKAEISDYVDQNAETFELVKATPNAIDLIYQVTADFYAENQRILTAEEATTLVENHLEEQATKLLALKKIKSKVAPAATAVKKPANSSTTLANSLSANPVTHRDPNTMTDEERREQAMQLLTFLE